MSEIRPLTRKEQLEWYKQFLIEQINKHKEELESTEMELKLEKEQKNEENNFNNIVSIRNDDNNRVR